MNKSLLMIFREGYNGRNTSLHKYSAAIFNIDIDNYEIEMIECKNCTQRISFILYNDSKN